MAAKRSENVHSHEPMGDQIATRRGWLAISLAGAPALLVGSTRRVKADPAAGTSGQLQYNNNGNLAGTPNLTFQPSANNKATALILVNENNTEQGDFDPRGF